MSSLTFFFVFVCIIAILFLIINLVLAPRNPYAEKISAFECGFHSYLQTRLPFDISFFIYALLFLLFDLEILLLYPFVVSSYVNGIYGLIIMLIFSIVITIGFVFELGKKALTIPSKQVNLVNIDPSSTKTISLISDSNKMTIKSQNN
jgi:NADH-ubiquinone oxidoreductase chain 3